ncbi:MAG: UvrD-helicase domain-containing protein [Porphyromonas sp.]|nr:UvrD-helicase domain-containing protein [Porphyromonas sp.]
MRLQLDDIQRQVIDFTRGRALVLGAPGTGKTEVLRQRVLKALQQENIKGEDMLCLTDAAMSGVGGGFVGSMADFCWMFLADNALLSPDVRVIKTSEQLEIISTLSRIQYRVEELKSITDCACMMREKELGFPEYLQVHRNANLRYRGLAMEYTEHKKKNNLVDIDDLLMLTLFALLREDYRTYKYSSYKWIVVDDVQDMGQIHYCILNRLSECEDSTFVMFGDESLRLSTDADKAPISEQVKVDSIFILRNNYRSSKSVVEMLNAYMKEQLAFVSRSSIEPSICVRRDEILPTLVPCRNEVEHCDMLAALVRQALVGDADRSVGILASTEGEVDRIWNLCEAHGLECKKKSDVNLDNKSALAQGAVIMTVAESVGKEFDQVIIYNVSDGIYPHGPTSAELDALTLYVALSRAKGQLYITYERELSPFLTKLESGLFYEMSEGQKQRMMKMERLFVKFSPNP